MYFALILDVSPNDDLVEGAWPNDEGWLEGGAEGGGGFGKAQIWMTSFMNGPLTEVGPEYVH